LLKTLDEVVVDETAGDPISGLKWTHKSLRKIQTALHKKGYAISLPTVSRLLQERGYSLQVNHKCIAGKQYLVRDEQFRYIVRWRQTYVGRGWPVISVDAKKRELIGNFKNSGRAWRNERRPVNMYDFPGLAHGIAIPYGIYDIGHNQGFVLVGISHNTPQFAIAAIRTWWLTMGQLFYPDQKHWLIEADCGGSNGNRSRVWKAGLQQLADEFGLIITVTHFPSGTSKWNPIEHRMFNLISANWAGQPLESYETILNYIRTTTSTTGFCCQTQLDPTEYKLKQKVSDKDFAALCLRPHKRFPQWNYTIYPSTSEPVV
jgi:hypothetical protein